MELNRYTSMCSLNIWLSPSFFVVDFFVNSIYYDWIWKEIFYFALLNQEIDSEEIFLKENVWDNIFCFWKIWQDIYDEWQECCWYNSVDCALTWNIVEVALEYPIFLRYVWFIRVEIIQEFFAILHNPITSWLQCEKTCKAMAFNFLWPYTFFSTAIYNTI